MSDALKLAQVIFDTEIQDIYEEGDSSMPTVNSIKAWLETNIGTLNILIDKNFEFDGATESFSPTLNIEEQNIFTQIYLQNFFKKLSLKSLRSISYTGGGDSEPQVSDWTELREGDSMIKRVASLASPQQKIQTSQTYKNLYTQAELKLRDLVYKYNLSRSLPNSTSL